MDYDTIVETEPNLIWQVDIQGLVADPRYSQRLVVCELFENQLKGDAIVLNPALVTQDDYQNTMYTYNSSTSPLEMGHTYVWQVIVLFNGMPVDQSETYQFTLYEPPLPLPKFYPVVFKNDGQTYQQEEGRIGLVTDEPGRLDLTVKIRQHGAALSPAFLQELKAGELQTDTVSEQSSTKRMFVLDIDSLELDPGFYTVTWTPKKGKAYVFNFNVE